MDLTSFCVLFYCLCVLFLSFDLLHCIQAISIKEGDIYKNYGTDNVMYICQIYYNTHI